MEKLGLVDLFKRRDIRSYLPYSARKIKVRTTYSYGPSIGRKLFNYNKVLKQLGNQNCMDNYCDCMDNFQEFVYAPHGHVHTGQLDIIKNKELREVMSMGAKFRLTPLVQKTKILTIIKDSILKLKKKFAKKCKIKEDCFDFWYERIIKSVDYRGNLFNNLPLESNDIFKLQAVKDYVNLLHNRFVLVPVDKASNNFAIICKRFYIDILKKELGIDSYNTITGNDVYKYVDISPTLFYKQQALANKALGNDLEKENCYIPLLYWTSKQHKNPYKFRFIAGATHCTNKTISIEVALALKCIKTQFKNYCAVIQRNSGLAYFWSIDNSIEFLSKISDLPIADSIVTNDFSTLYTNLPLDSIYSSLELLIIKMYKNSGSHGMMVNAVKRKAFWSHGANYSGYKEYTIDKLLDALKFVLYHTYVQFDGHIFKQIKGVPMGGNASPFIADLYLSWHEFCFMEALKKSKLDADYALAKLLSTNSRYIDDIAILNFLNFGTIAERIYHPSLVLEKSNSGIHYDTFLDLNIRVQFNKFIIGIYHKIDDFDFEVINYPFPDSNIHTQVGYNAFYSQLVRFYRLCNNVTDFNVRVYMIYKKLSSRGYKDNILYRYFLKFCNRYPVLTKFGSNANALWSSSIYFQNVSCASYDYDAIRNIVRPCKVSLQDIYSKEKTPFLPNLKTCSLPLEDFVRSDRAQSIPLVDAVKPKAIHHAPNVSIINYIPCGLENRSNHCYVNTLIQVTRRLLCCLGDAVHINNNDEGLIFKKFLECCDPSLDTNFFDFKILLARFNSFFDGSVQRDAHEAFLLLLDIFHNATKESLVNTNDGQQEDESLVTSYIKDSMYFTIKTNFTCTSCGNSNISFTNSCFINLYATYDNDIGSLIKGSMCSNLTKFCEVCFLDTLHIEAQEILELPKVLCFVINRSYGSFSDYTHKIKVTNSPYIKINSSEIQLIASIHHHGHSNLSGHYTANVFFSNCCFLCNDNHISKFDKCDQISDTVYVMFYTKAD